MAQQSRIPLPFAAPQATRPRSGRRAFTLIELLVVIGIIVLLISILIPVVSRVKTRAQVATVQAQINGIDAAIQSYSQAFGGALPGPIPNDQLGPNATLNPVINIAPTAGGGQLTKVTGSENLVLGLLGGLQPVAGGALQFDPAIVGRGPRGLRLTNPKSNNAFIDGVKLTPPPYGGGATPQGMFVDASGDADDSVVPEIVDSFSESMPILFLRATKGGAGVISERTAQTIPAPNPPTNLATAQYHLQDIVGYTDSSIGVGKSIGYKEYTTAPPNNERPHGLQDVQETATLDKSSGGYVYPFAAFPYFQNPSIPPSTTGRGSLNFRSTPHNKDGFILISAGADRVYGTRDDITNFGQVGQ